MHLSEDGFDGETASELAEARVKRLQEQVSQILIFVGHAPSCGGHGANRYQQTMPTVQHDVETDPLERTVRGPPSTQPCPGSQEMPAGAGGARRLLVELRSGRWIFDADWPWPQASSQACQLSSAQGAPELEQPDAWQAAWQARFSESHREATVCTKLNLPSHEVHPDPDPLSEQRNLRAQERRKRGDRLPIERRIGRHKILVRLKTSRQPARLGLRRATGVARSRWFQSVGLS